MRIFRRDLLQRILIAAILAGGVTLMAATLDVIPLPQRCVFREARFAADVAAALVGEQHVVRALPPSMGAEDFSFMLQVRPGAYLRLGQGGEGSCFLHNSRYDFNDDVLPLGAALFASLVERSLVPATP